MEKQPDMLYKLSFICYAIAEKQIMHEQNGGST